MVVPIIAAMVGGVMANKAAKTQANAIDRANEQNNQYLNAAMPYIEDNMANVSGSMQAMRPYTGETYAAPNQIQNAANQSLYDFGQNQMNVGQNLMSQNANFGQNAQSLYDQFTGFGNQFNDLYNQNLGLANQYSNLNSQLGNYQGQFDNLTNQSQNVTDRFGVLADRVNEDRIGAANDYAMNNASPLVDAMLRDDRRSFEEVTMPGINMGASGSGNTNSSRAGIASAVAQRGFDDRAADVRSDVVNQLRNAKLAQDNTQFNQAMDATRGMGNSMTNTGAFLGNAVGNIGNQANMVGNMGTAYGNAANNLTSAGNQFTNATNANQQIGNAMNTGMNMAGTGINNVISAGLNQQQNEQAQMNADKAAYDYAQGFDYNLGKDYGSFLTNSNPGQGSYQANLVNPMAETVAGMGAGFGFGNQFGAQMMNPNNAMYDNVFGFKPGQMFNGI